MELIIGITGLVLGLLSVVASFYYGNRKKRLINKMEKYQNSIDQVEKYSGDDAVKMMVHDSFNNFSYAVGLSLLAYSVEGITNKLFSFSGEAEFFISQLALGVYFAAGILLIQTYATLSNAYRPNESIAALQKKVDKLKDEISKH